MRFAFRLALSLGVTVQWLARNMTTAEFEMWVVFHAIEPFGPRQDDERAAIAATLPAVAFSGARINPADLFRSLREPDGAAKTDKRKAIGRNFRLWAVSNCPQYVATPPDRTRAE